MQDAQFHLFIFTAAASPCMPRIGVMLFLFPQGLRHPRKSLPISRGSGEIFYYRIPFHSLFPRLHYFSFYFLPFQNINPNPFGKIKSFSPLISETTSSNKKKHDLKVNYFSPIVSIIVGTSSRGKKLFWKISSSFRPFRPSPENALRNM